MNKAIRPIVTAGVRTLSRRRHLAPDAPRRYSIATLFVITAFGVLTSFAARGPTPADTPWLGVVERICVGGFLLWIAVLAISLRRADRPAPVFSLG